MGTKAQSLAHTKWLCKYHIVFTPKYRRKIIFAQLRDSIKEILQSLCKNLSINNFSISLPESDEGSSQMRESQMS